MIQGGGCARVRDRPGAPTDTPRRGMTRPSIAGMLIGMQRFVDDDGSYRASCGTISGKPARGATFTGEYVKVALHNRGCSRGLRPPDSSSDLAM